MPRSLRLFAFFAFSAFVLGSAGYLVLHAVMPDGYVFGELYKMYHYHEAHPFQYIAVVAVTYAGIATACVILWPNLAGWRRFVAIVGIIVSTIVVASVPGGVLWSIHNMQAKSFTTGPQFWNDLLWGASTGLDGGWVLIILSVPYNVLGLIVGYALTYYGFRIGTTRSAPGTVGI